MKKLFTLLMMLICVSAIKLNAQDRPAKPTLIGTGVFKGETLPLKDIAPVSAMEYQMMKDKAEKKLLNKKLRERFYPNSKTALPKGPDAVWQKTMGNRSAVKAPIANFEGQSSPYYPPDCNGAAGPNHYMQTINSTYAIYNKTGALLAGPTNMNNLFGGVTGSGCNDGDPLILYDEQASRWLAVEFSICGANDYMLIAVSTTSDPTGTWYSYSFDVADMPDYEKFGIWQDGYYMGDNNSGANDIYVFQRSVMLAGGASPGMVAFANPNRPTSIDGFMCVPPVDNDGSFAPSGAPGIFIAFNDDAIGGGTDQLWIYELAVNWTTPTSSTFSRVQQLAVSAFDSNFGADWTNIAQPGTTQQLDAIPQVVMNVPQYRNFGTYQTIVCCHTVDVDNTDHAGVRWYELRRGTQASGNWAIRQQGTYAPDANSRWMGSISLNGSGKIGLGYSVSSSTVYPSIRYAGQSSAAYNAATGLLDIPEASILAGTTSQTAAERWGDYSAMSVDPSDDQTFWFTTQYIGSGGTRNTRIASFKFGNNPSVTTLSASSITATTATINGTINPNGLATTYYFQWGTTTAYGDSTAVTSAGSANSTFPVTANLTGLLGGTVYHFRLVGVNSDGNSYGGDMAFISGGVTLTTTTPSTISLTTASSGGNITSDGGLAITARGVCWATTYNPTIVNSHTTDGTGAGIFTSAITGLTSNTTYHVRAYATNSTGTYYGSDIQFTTLCSIFTLPFTEGFTNITIPNCWTQVDYIGNGQIWQFGTITTGLTFPILTGNYAYLNSDGYGTGNSQNADLVSPTLDLTGYTSVNLAFNHYFKQYSGSSGTLSYSINNGLSWTIISTYTTTSPTNPTTFSQAIAGIAGQAQVKFKWNYIGAFAYHWAIDDISITGVAVGPPLVTTASVTSITQTTAISGGNVTSGGTATVTARGVCWSTTANPLVSGNHTTDGTGTGVFSSSITGLTPITTYHVRAYATNSLGTVYGSDVSFISSGAAFVSSTTAVTAISYTTATSGGNILSDGGAAVTARGVCWATTANPTILSSHSSNGTGIGTFVSTLAGLTASTTYHVRAYATNANGTFYGPDILFSTLCTVFTLPFTENFNNTYAPACWTQNDNIGSGQIWQFGTITVGSILPALSGNYAYLNSDGYGSGGTQNADLITPTLDLSSNATVNLAFNYYFRVYSAETGTLSYSIDNGLSWTIITTLTATSTTNPTFFSQIIPGVAGQSQVKFKWNYVGIWGYYWGIDNISITSGCIVPNPAGIITGTASVCPSATLVSYSVPAITNALTYTWAYTGSGVSITPNLNNITINFDTNATSGYLSVYASNACGNGTISANYPITVNTLPAAAAAISGSTSVCPGQTSVTYTVPFISGATSYIWTLPLGATGSSTSNSITVSFDTTAASGFITVRGHNPCYDGASSSLAININSMPKPQILLNEAFNYTVGTLLTNQGWIGHSGTGTNNVSIQSGNLTYAGYPTPSGQMIKILSTGQDVHKVFGPKTSSNMYAAFLVKVSAAGSGDYFAHFIKAGTTTSFFGRVFVKKDPLNTAKVLFGVGKATNSASLNTVYSSTSLDTGVTHLMILKYTVNSATSFDDVVSLFINPSITGTEGLPNLEAVDVGNDYDSTYTGFAFRQGTSGSSPTVYIDGIRIASNWADVVGYINPITGLATVCQGQTNVVYTAPPMTNATSYVWTLPTGASGIISSNTISVNFGTSAISGNITVKAVNSCGESPVSVIPITVNPLPNAAGNISGNTLVCPGQNNVPYSVQTISNASSYNWTLPLGVTGSSTTNAINVDFGTIATTGNITVSGHNACGDGPISTLIMTDNSLPATVGAIISSDTVVCQGQFDAVYYLPAIANATSYMWTLPIGANGNSSTNTIHVNYGTSSISGEILVNGINSCGDGPSSSLAVTVINTLANAAERIIGDTIVCQGQGLLTYTVPLIPNSASYVWTLPSGVTGSSNTNSITVNYGLTAQSGFITVRGHNPCGDGIAFNLPIVVNPKPSAPIIESIIHPSCSLATGSVMLGGLPTTSSWTINPIGITGNGTNALISGLAHGVYSYTVSNIWGCTSTLSQNAVINIQPTTPNAPTGNSNQAFCSITFPTVANLSATGTTIQWYAASTGGSPLSSSTALINGVHYWASQTVGVCESTSRLDVTALVYTTPSAPTGDIVQYFCYSPTIANLVVSGVALKWYDAATGGNLLLSTHVLTNGEICYASQTINGCESTNRLGVSASITVVPISITTNPITNITLSGATFSGELSSSCLNPTIVRGFVCATHANPQLSDPTTIMFSSGNGLGSFTSIVSTLTSNADYWVRAFAINVTDTIYGAILPFKTGIWPFFNLEIKNDVQVSDRAYEFDVYIKHTGNYMTPVQFELSSIQMGIYFNGAILNGGTPTATVVPGYSDINANQQQNNTNMYIVGPTTGMKTIKVTAKTTSAGSGTIISTTTGTRVMRIRLTNTLAFAQLKPNMSYSFTATGPSWQTMVNAYIATISKDITVNGTFINSGLNNPTLNVVTIYNMTGGGTNCNGNVPVTVGLDGSQQGFDYQLKKDGLNYGAVVPGTGNALSWNITESGIYTCVNNIASMNGSAQVNLVNTGAPSGSAAQSFCYAASLADLVISGTAVKWYDAAIAGNLLLSTQTLVNGSTYYASQTISGCESNSRFGVTVSIYPVPVTVVTKPITVISLNGATFNGELNSSCLNPTVVRGFVYAAHANPIIGDPLSTTVNSGSGLGLYSSVVASLNSNSNYWMRAYAINFTDTVYGAILPFKTGIWPFFNLELKNDAQISDRIYEFDVYLKHTGNFVTPPQFELSSIQMGIYFNSAILNGGTATATIVAGSSEINAPQQQSNTNMYLVGPTTGNKTIKVTAKTTSAGSGTIISTTTGTRVMRIRLTNTLAFAQLKPNMSFSFTTVGPSWQTIVNAYITAVSKDINTNGTFITTGLNNPTLNVAIAYNMTGGGAYCTGGSPIVVGLSGSQLTYSYQLKKDGVNYGSAVAGTGAPLSWNLTLPGTYTCVSGTVNMNGSAVVSLNIVPAPTGSTSMSFNNAATVADLVATGSNIKWYDAPSGGNLLSPTTALIDGHTYYASQSIAGCESQSRLGVSVTINLYKMVNLHLILEGLFNHSTHRMTEAMEGNANVPQYGYGIADKVNVDLFEENSPYGSIGVSVSGVDLDTSGLASFYISSIHSGNYYIRVTNRNHLETWSALAVPFNTPTVNYYFTSDVMQAYGMDAQVQVAPGMFGFYLGDLDANGWIDAEDFNLFEPGLTFGLTGFLISDFDGNGWVDSDDFNLFEPRLTYGMATQHP